MHCPIHIELGVVNKRPLDFWSFATLVRTSHWLDRSFALQNEEMESTNKEDIETSSYDKDYFLHRQRRSCCPLALKSFKQRDNAIVFSNSIGTCNRFTGID